MLRYRMWFLVATAIIEAFACLPVSAETWRLEKGGDWQPLSARSQDDRYLLAVAEVKKLVDAGQTDAAADAVVKLKNDFPEIAAEDFDAFIDAEMLLSKGEFVKAVRRYEKFLNDYPESELRDAALEREFRIATAFLAGRKKKILGLFKIKGYAEGEKIMTWISRRAGLASPLGIKAATAVAKSYESRRMFHEAHSRWLMISARWPTGQIGKDALLGMARSKLALYNGSKFDTSNLITARTYYLRYRRLLEDTGEADMVGEIDAILTDVDEQLASKQLSVGQYYERIGNRQSAHFYYQMVARDWPNCSAAKKAQELLSRNTAREKGEK